MEIVERTKRIGSEIEKDFVHFLQYDWKHKNTILFLLVLSLAVYLVYSGRLEQLLIHLGNYGYLGGFVAGFFFSYGITTPLAIIALFYISGPLNPFLLSFIGAFGAVIGDYIIFQFVKDKAGKIIGVYRGRKIKLPKIRNKLLIKISPLIAGLIVASPFPDELAATLFGFEKFDTKRFLLYSYIFKFIGIFIITYLGKVF